MVQGNVHDRRCAITPSPRRRLNPRLIAPIAFIVAFAAIALEIAYSIGRFFSQTVEQIH
jgi:hypothetical protein